MLPLFKFSRTSLLVRDYLKKKKKRLLHHTCELSQPRGLQLMCIWGLKVHERIFMLLSYSASIPGYFMPHKLSVP